MSNNTISFFLVSAGMLLLTIGIIQFIRQRDRIRNFRHAEGTVIELLPQRTRGKYIRVNTAEGIQVENKYLYRPVVEFKPQSGRAVRFTASVASHPAPYQVGDKVKVLYDSNHPKQAQIHSFVYLWFNVLMLIGFGLLTLGMGLLGLLLS